jgi:hypothetical protein
MHPSTKMIKSNFIRILERFYRILLKINLVHEILQNIELNEL